MTHKFDPSNQNKLDNPWRKQNMPPDETLQALGLEVNDIVADIGCGIGYFTMPIAKIVERTNKIYALDTSKEMLLEVKSRAKAAEIDNIITIETEEYDLKLSDETVSFSLLVNVLHEIEEKELFLKEIKRIMKQSGKIAIVEWEKKKTEFGPPVGHRIDRNDVKVLLKELDFAIIKETTFGDHFYGMVGLKSF